MGLLSLFFIILIHAMSIITSYSPTGDHSCDYLLFKVDVFDYSGVGVIHPDAPDVCGGQSKIHQSLL